MKNPFCLLLTLGMLFIFGCEGGGSGSSVLRSADPCNAWEMPSWQTGPGAVLTPQLRDGNASHDLWPSEIIYYSVLENTTPETPINYVLVLTYHECSGLLSLGREVGDFELRLLQPVGYASASNKYNGYYKNVVASTFQWRLYQERGLTFAQAQQQYPFISSGASFEEVYARNAKIMNNILGTNFSQHPSSQGYYQDFAGRVDADKIQQFLVTVGSPLQENLFQQPPVLTTAIDYSNMGAYCQ